jgi:hypothetical protein
MDYFLLDVVDVATARGAGNLPMIFYIIVAATILTEAVIMLLMKYNTFGKSFLHSLLVNIASVAAGFLLYELAPGMFEPGHLSKFLGLFFITLATELPVLYMLNKSKHVRDTVTAGVIMNAITYFLFWMYTQYVA